MGFETRAGRPYYYRKERRGRRVRSVYVGGGEGAELLAALDAVQQEERAEKRQQARAAREELRAEDAELDALGEIMDELAQATLLAHDCHQHKRQWRRKRR
jgi:hypothetical protein